MESESTSPQPLRYRAIAAGLRVAEQLIPKSLLPGHNPARLMRIANTTPTAGMVQGLVRLTAALDRESELSLFGMIAIHQDFLRLLRNADYIESQHRQRPEISQSPVTAPIFILGLPRSGTTFLHSLLALDVANQVPRNWQTQFPQPRPPDFKASAHWEVRKVEQQLGLFAAIAEGFTQAHPITADSPQECTEITAHTFQSLRFDTIFRIPSYQAWLDVHGHAEAFQFHKKFLQVLQQGITRPRWVLKSPDHVFSLDAILNTYPDARFVVVHRDPMKVFGSVANLTEVLRRPFLKNIDPSEIGEQVTSRWIMGAKNLISFDQRLDVPAGRKIQIQHDDLIADPLQAITRVYELFNLPLSTEFASAIEKMLITRPHGGYTGNRNYSLSHFNIKTERLIPQFSDYIDHFGVTP